MNRTARVFFQDQLAGWLSETASGYQFQYSSEYLQSPSAKAISFSFPLRTEKYEASTLFPFFDGLIPEGWYLEIVSKKVKVDLYDRFGLLLATAKHTIGAVTIL
ncbi:MAG: HipA N-terminal domain-containing protein [Deltaproteobacteria bacterium]|nr:HipA N-terminal domain-containing protein [Deltaproteobacteria bacterium]